MSTKLEDDSLQQYITFLCGLGSNTSLCLVNSFAIKLDFPQLLGPAINILQGTLILYSKELFILVTCFLLY